jgi:hypothetical protein
MLADQLAVGHIEIAEGPGSEEVLTLEEAAILLRLPIEAVRTRAVAGDLPGRAFGDEWRFSRVALLAWLADGEAPQHGTEPRTKRTMGSAARRPIVLVPGACLGGWAWRDVAARLRAQGHDAYPMTLTGLGDHAHLAHADIDLETHITDVVNLLDYEALNDAVPAQWSQPSPTAGHSG